MSPGPAEEAGKVATGLIDSLRSTPLVLALIVFNAIFITGVYFSVRNERASAERIMSLLISEKVDMDKALSVCLPNQGR